MPLCKKCGVEINHPFKYCDTCGDEVAASQGQLIRRGRVAVRRLKAAADASGNPKVFTAKECSQGFLKSLIPGSIGKIAEDERGPMIWVNDKRIQDIPSICGDEK